MEYSSVHDFDIHDNYNPALWYIYILLNLYERSQRLD